ncbi:MAG: hypothetical protein R3325_04230 [Thermoanaerobaculia bacterium]|nr:hypothetical protein [Thermoanaerobaculia bacterium]
MTDPRYPEIEVRTRSKNPLALVAAIRFAMRQARVARSEIQRFSSEALKPGDDPRETRRVCKSWVRVHCN